jgi:hypothetical protein
MQNKFKLVLFVFAFALVSFVPVYANHSWGGYHWARTANPFTLKLGGNVTSGWNSYLSTASSKWSLSSVLDTAIVSGQSTKNCRATLGRVEVCNSKYGNNGWLGIASVWISSGHITQGTVKLNDTYFNTSKYNKSAWKNLVMCQEVAHTFGLDHQDENFSNANLGSCMDYTDDPDGSIKHQLDNQYPNAHDYEELEIIYAHLDSINTTSQTVSSKNFGNEVSSLQSDWGKAVRQDQAGKDSIFERDLGHGNKVLTHVFWAE